MMSFPQHSLDDSSASFAWSAHWRELCSTFFLFRYASSHTSMIFFGVAVLYGTGFLLMCLNVKEGSYPPPEAMHMEKPSPLAYIRTFFQECFSHRLFCLVFAYSGIIGFAGTINAFSIFMEFSIGLNLEEIGQIAGAALFIGMLLMYPMGSSGRSLPPSTASSWPALAVFASVETIKLLFLFFEFQKAISFWIYAAIAVIAIPINVANAAAQLPLLMRLFPHERFGQFCAANAVCGALGMIVGGFLGGLFLDLMKSIFP